MAIQVLKPKFRVEECLNEIRECLEKGWTGMGFKTVELEEKWKEYTGHPHAHFLNSATVGLDLAFKLLKRENKWESHHEVITTPITFVSTNHAILYNDLTPCFADVDDSLCLDPVEVEKKINKNTKAVIFVGYGGRVGQLEKIIELCQKHNLKLILDAAHMSGTTVQGKKPGTWHGIDVTVYSYQAVKNLPTADSGMICFREEKMDKLVRQFSWLGIDKDTFSRSGAQGNYKWSYHVGEVGYKYHGNSIMAAIALVQLKYLDEENSYRWNLVQTYQNALAHNEKIRIIPVHEGCSCHIFAIEVDCRDQILDFLAEKEIFCGVHYRDNIEYPMYAFAEGTCPKARDSSQKILSLPLHLELTVEEAKNIAALVNEFVKGGMEHG